MKPYITFIFLLLFGIASAQKPYKIRGNIKGIEEGTVVSLYEQEGDELRLIKQDTTKAGLFLFEGIVSKPTEYAIMAKGAGFPSSWLEVWVAPNALINITGTKKLLKTWTVKSNVKEQLQLNLFTDASKSDIDEEQKLFVTRNEIMLNRDNLTTDQKKVTRQRLDSIDRAIDSIDSLISKRNLTLLEKMPISQVWMNKLRDIASMDYYYKKEGTRELIIPLYNKLTKPQKESELGREIQTYLYPPKVVKAGDRIADTKLYDLQGKTHSLSDFKGKYILLDFWSIGCYPCLNSLPELKKLSEKYADSLTIVSLSMDKKKETWANASKEKKINWVNLSDQLGHTGIASKYGVNGIPHFVLISPDGIIKESWVGYSDNSLEPKVKKYLKQ